MRAGISGLVTAVLLFGGAASARAQGATLLVTGLPANFATPTGAEFKALSITYPTVTSYTVTGNGWKKNETSTETVYVQCVAPCPASGPKALATLQWARSDTPTAWNSITTTPVAVESVVLNAGNGTPPRNPTYTNSVIWRFTLSWTGDPPGAATTFNVRLTLTQTP